MKGQLIVAIIANPVEYSKLVRASKGWAFAAVWPEVIGLNSLESSFQLLVCEGARL